jgi:hypothetical protein
MKNIISAMIFMYFLKFSSLKVTFPMWIWGYLYLVVFILLIVNIYRETHNI